LGVVGDDGALARRSQRQDPKVGRLLIDGAGPATDVVGRAADRRALREIDAE
jgi:hypothetical protein